MPVKDVRLGEVEVIYNVNKNEDTETPDEVVGNKRVSHHQHTL